MTVIAVDITEHQVRLPDAPLADGSPVWVETRPNLRRAYILAGDILTGLGKRHDLAGKGRNQHEEITLATVWLRAHRTADLVITDAQRLHPKILGTVCRLATNAEVDLWLLHRAPTGDAFLRALQRRSDVTKHIDDVPPPRTLDTTSPAPPPFPSVPRHDVHLFRAGTNMLSVADLATVLDRFGAVAASAYRCLAAHGTNPATVVRLVDDILAAAPGDDHLITDIRGLQLAAWHHDLFLNVDLATLLHSEERPRCPRPTSTTRSPSTGNRIASSPARSPDADTDLTTSARSACTTSTTTVQLSPWPASIAPCPPGWPVPLVPRCCSARRRHPDRRSPPLRHADPRRLPHRRRQRPRPTRQGTPRRTHPTRPHRLPTPPRPDPDGAHMINATRLRHHRTAAGLSQRKLAKLAGLGPLGIHRLEAGSDGSRLPFGVVIRIAAALDTSIDQLLDAPDAAARPVAVDPVDAFKPPVQLDANQARLLRRLHRGDDRRRTLTKADRALTLPALLRSGVITQDTDHPTLAPAVHTALTMPETTPVAAIR